MTLNEAIETMEWYLSFYRGERKHLEPPALEDEELDAITALLDAMRMRPATEPPDDDRWVLAKFGTDIGTDSNITVARYYRDEGRNNSYGYEPATEGWETAEGKTFEWDVVTSWRELPE